MKKNIFVIAALAAALFGASSCTEDTLSPESVITADIYEKNDFDKWLEFNYVNPYNIDFKYRFEMNESDMNYYTIPADMESANMMAHLVKYLCVDTYDEVAGLDFTRGYFPKMFFLIGEWEYRNNGTFILGTAEGGRKILLSGLNSLEGIIKQGPKAMNEYYFKTIHHEFTHIMNQHKIIPADFQLVTGTGYVGDMWSESPYNQEFLTNGFISDYSQHSYQEDFAEMLSTYITNDAETWNSLMEKAGQSASLIEGKLDIVRRYMMENFNIDIENLRDAVQRRQADILEGKVDLTDISV